MNAMTKAVLTPALKPTQAVWTLKDLLAVNVMMDIIKQAISVWVSDKKVYFCKFGALIILYLINLCCNFNSTNFIRYTFI